jgi:hypothetical protein
MTSSIYIKSGTCTICGLSKLQTANIVGAPTVFICRDCLNGMQYCLTEQARLNLPTDFAIDPVHAQDGHGGVSHT